MKPAELAVGRDAIYFTNTAAAVRWFAWRCGHQDTVRRGLGLPEELSYVGAVR